MPPSHAAPVDRRREFGGFLRSRRGRLRPDDVGPASSGRRRVPGLRRDEVARLADVSVEYYTRLEQGRGGRPSDAVLDALARALRLTAAERDHLFDLAVAPLAPVAPAEPGAAPAPVAAAGEATAPAPAAVRPGIAAVVAAMPDTPVVVYNRRLDILATNRLGSLVVADPTGAGTGFGNCVLATFLDPVMRRVYVDWDEVARDVVGLIRRFAGRYPHDTRIDGLVAELSARSEEFRTLWAAHDVRHVLRGRKRLRHPVVGEIALDYEHLALPDDPDLGMTVYTAPPRSEARRALDRLAAREAAGA